MHQLVFADLPGLGVKNRYLLPPRMKITTDNRLHGRLLLIQQFWPSTKNYSILDQAFLLIPSIHAQFHRVWVGYL